MNEVLASAEFWMAVSGLVGVIALFIPAPYKPILLVVQKILEIISKKKLPNDKTKSEDKKNSEVLKDVMQSPADIMRDAEARFKENRGK